MGDLRERLQELADAATRAGATAGPEQAIRRGRRRRRRIAAGTAAVLAITLVVGVAGATGRLPDRTPSTPLPPAAVPSTTLPPVEIQPGMPVGEVAAQLWQDTKTALRECGVATAGGPRLLAHGTAYGSLWTLGARPPRNGKGMCWANGLSGPQGGSGIGTNGSARSPSKQVVAGGSSGDHYGSVDGYVTKRAARVRVLFHDGRAPLEVEPLQAGPRFPVNFYIAFYPQQGRTEDWLVAKVVALDAAGHVVASCRTGYLPEGTCTED
jgi:hypothetical protein